MTSRRIASVAIGAAIISVGSLASRLLGFVRENQLLNAFGDSDVMGAYNSAFMVPDLLYYLLAGGALSSAFIPVFSAYLAKDQREDAYRTASSIANLMLIAVAVGVVLELIFARQLVWLIAPGYRSNPAVFDLTVLLTREMCVMVLFTALSGLLTGILNSQHHFLTPTIVWLTYNLGIIFGVVFLRNVQWHGQPLGIHGAALGVLIGAVSLVVVQLPVVFRFGFRYQPVIDLAHEGVRKVLRLFAPVMIGLSLSQINLLMVPLVIGSILGAPAVTDVRVANRLVLVPLGLFAIAIATAAFPRLSQQAAVGETTEFRLTLARSMKAIILLTVPSAVLLFILGEPINCFLWAGGKFGLSGVRASSFVLALFAFSLFGLGLVQVVNRAFYALHDMRTPVVWGALAVALNIPLARYLALHTGFAYGAVAVGTTLTSTLSTFALLDILRRRLGGIGGRALLSLTLRASLAGLAMLVVVYIVARLLAPELPGAPGEHIAPPDYLIRWPAPHVPFSVDIKDAAHFNLPPGLRLHLLIQIAVASASGFATFVAVCFLLRVREISDVLDRLRARFRRPSAVA